jgi:hypothetical protein
VDIQFNTAMQAAHNKKPGISRAEVFVAVVVVVLLSGILLPYILKQRTMSRRIMCDYRLTQLGYAVQLAETASQQLPTYRTAWPDLHISPVPVITGDRIVGWQFSLLPYLRLTPDAATTTDPDAAPRFGPLHHHFSDYVDDSTAQSQQRLHKLYLNDFVCPANNPPQINKGILPGGWNSYVANGGLPDAVGSPDSIYTVDSIANGLFVDDPALSKHAGQRELFGFQYIADGDGLDSTLMLSENIDSGKWTDTSQAALLFHWQIDAPLPAGVKTARVLGINIQRGQAISSDIRFARISSNHVGGANAIFVSGRTQFISENIDPRVLRYMMTSRDAECMWPGTTIPIFE